MSTEQLKKALQAPLEETVHNGYPLLKREAVVSGRRYLLVYHFLRATKLGEIILFPIEKGDDGYGCMKTFDEMFAGVKAVYGDPDTQPRIDRWISPLSNDGRLSNEANFTFRDGSTITVSASYSVIAGEASCTARTAYIAAPIGERF